MEKTERQLTVPYLFAVILLSSFGGFNWSILLNTAVALLTFLHLVIFFNKHRIRIDLKAQYPAVLFLAAALVSCAGNNMIFQIKGDFPILLASIYLYLVAGTLDLREKRRLVNALILVAVFYSTVLCAEYAMLRLNLMNKFGFLQVMGINTNMMSGYLLILLPIANTYEKGGGPARIVIMSLIIAGIAVLGSYAAVAAAVVVVAAVLFDRYGISRYTVAALAAVIIAAVALKYFSGGSSVIERMHWWKTALVMFIKNPVNGVGWGNYGPLYLNFKTSISQNSYFAHNLFFQIAAEAGIVGLAALAFLLAGLTNNFKALIREKKEFYYPVLLGLGALILYNMFDYSFYVPAVMLVFWTFAGFGTRVAVEERKRRLIGFAGQTVITVMGCAVLVLPQMSYFFYLKAVDYMGNNDYESAYRMAKKAEMTYSLPAEYHSLMAQISFSSKNSKRDDGSVDRAIFHQRNAITRYKSAAVLWSDLAWLYSLKGQNRSAVSAMKNAVKYDKMNVKYRKSLKELEGQEQ